MTDKKRSQCYEKILEYLSYASLGISVIGVTLFIMTFTSPSLIKKVVSNGSYDQVQNGIEFFALFGVALMLATNAALIKIRAGNVDSTLYSAQKSMSKASDHLTIVRDDVLKTKKIAVDSAFSVIEKVLDLPRQKYTISDDKIEPHEAWLSSFTHHVDAWYERLIKSPEKQNSSEEFALYAWLTAGRSYFTEEAYGLHRGELVTSARNYVNILSGLAADFAKFAKKTNNQKLYYYSITPVNPKDWYQFPHGNVKPHFYCEEEFIAVFHRTLNAMVQNNPGRIEHRRYIICADDQGGWKNTLSAIIGSNIIEYKKNIIKDLLGIKIELVPLSYNDFLSYFPELYQIQQKIGWKHPYLSLEKKRRVYMWSTDWKQTWKDTDGLKQIYNDNIALFEKLPVIKGASEWEKISKLGLNALKKEWEEHKQNYAYKVIMDKLGPDLIDTWEKVWDVESTWIKPPDGKFDYSGLIHDCHRLSLELQREDIRKILPPEWEEKDLMHMLLYMGFTCRDLTQRHTNEKYTPIPLIHEFADTLHTQKKEGLFLLPIKNDSDDEVSKYWLDKDKGVEPEVSLFGFGPNNGNGDIKDIKWGLAVTVSRLIYPFEVVRVKFKTGQDDLKIYEECLKKVEEKKAAEPVSTLLT